MFKNVISSLIAIAVVLTPVAAAAQNRNGNRLEQQNNRVQAYNAYNQRRNRGVSTGAAIGIGLGALVLGGVLADRNNQNRNFDPRFGGGGFGDPRFGGGGFGGGFGGGGLGRGFGGGGFNNGFINCRVVISSGIDANGNYYEQQIARC